MQWCGSQSALASFVARSRDQILEVYAIRPQLAEEHFNIELAVAEGGYGHRQIYELVQNGADALLRAEMADEATTGRIEIVLTSETLYCANEGAPVDERGIDSLLGSYIAVKRGAEIGRFGLGFKSVLAVTDRPEFFSRPVSLDFDPDLAREQIQEAGRLRKTKIEHTPRLRIAQVIDPETASDADPTLAELMEWASTVVRLRRVDDGSWLSDDLRDFPAEFLLFAGHVRDLVLRDLTTGTRREIRVERVGERFRLIEGARDEEWSVFSETVRPTDEARSDAGDLAKRDELPVAWAVRVGGSPGVGKFWAFFPTTYETTLSGIINSPWKTNPDRENLLSGAFNEFLLDEAAELVAANLASVATAEDPSRHLDLMPARGREARNWADRRVTEKVYELAAARESLPDQEGRLRHPRELRVHPDTTPSEALELWASFPFAPVDWVHRSAQQRDRRPRVDRLLEAADNEAGITRYEDWLEALACASGPASSGAAIKVASLLQATLSPTEFADVRNARIVLTTSGELVQPSPDQLFIGSPPDVGVKTWSVDPKVLIDPFVEQQLRDVFGISEVDTTADFGAFVAGSEATDGGAYWEEFWTLARGIAEHDFVDVLTRHQLDATRILARAVDGNFRPISQLLLAGSVVKGNADDSRATVDEQYHSDTLDLLRALGLRELPGPDGGETDRWFVDGYRPWVISELKRAAITVRDPARMASAEHRAPSHLGLLEEIGDDGRCRLTREVLRIADVLDPWHWHGSASGRDLAVESPVLWKLKTSGMLDTSLGPRSIDAAVGADLDEYRRLLPVADGVPGSVARALGVACDIETLSSEQISAGLARLAEEVDDRLIGRFCAAICAHFGPPARIRCKRAGTHVLVAPGEVTAVADPDLFRDLAAIAPVLLVPSTEAADQLVEHWGLQRDADTVQRELVFDAIAPGAPLLDEFPNLRLIEESAPYRSLDLIRCRELTQILRREDGQVTNNLDHAFDDNIVYWRVPAENADQAASDRSLLSVVSQRLGLQLDPNEIESLIQNKRDADLQKRIELVRQEPDDAHRLLRLVGEDVLRKYIPQALLTALATDADDLEPIAIAEAALAVSGVEVLQELRADLERCGLQPPTQWAGSRAAQTFVRDLGFPREFAGWESAKRPPTLEIDGPIDLPDLHDFQQKIRRRFRELLRGSGKQRRAMLSLPTGAGKTRVAVQSIVEHFRDDEIDGPVLWIAQTDELCEQAVQTFSEVWRGIGPRRPLVISRLWSSNEAEPVDAREQVVVATIAKLTSSIVDNPEYEWLSDAAAVIVDEAHESGDAPSYTRMLQWLGLGGGTRGKDRCPLIGLTATPFKGASKERTKQLANRYGGVRLDLDVIPDDPYQLLEDRGILARVVHQTIDGVAIELDDDEKVEWERFQRLPRAVEARVGADADRNRTLLDKIRSLPDDWPILLFAASVEHAQTMAALLRLQGVSAAAISSATQAPARRHYIDTFRAGRLRVLTNYGVLTTGFDAPEIRAVFIARPTFSPNLYQQMIGRGLRGPANGGKPECLIVDVEDNIQLFGGKFAFTEFDYLWAGR